MSGSAEAAVAAHAEPTSEALFAKLSPGPGRSATEVERHQRARIHSAMLEIAAERGYNAATVRELARLAGVSTRTFYEHYSGKEECFLRTHELVVRRALRHITSAKAKGHDLHAHVSAQVGALYREMARDAYTGRLMLVEAYAVGAAIDQVRWAERALESRMAETFDVDPKQDKRLALLVRAVQAGLLSVARSRLLKARESELPDLAEGMADWAVSLYESVNIEAVDSEQPGLRGCSGPDRPPSSSSSWMGQGPAGDRALVLSTVERLIGSGGFDEYTTSQIRLATGISRERFEAHFGSADECLIEVLEQRSEKAIASAARVRDACESPRIRADRAMAVLSKEFAREPNLARLRFVDVLGLGSAGMESHQRFIAALGVLLDKCSPPEASPASLFTEAAAGAVWGSIRHYAAGGKTQQLPRVSWFLTCLATSGPIHRAT